MPIYAFWRREKKKNRLLKWSDKFAQIGKQSVDDRNDSNEETRKICNSLNKINLVENEGESRNNIYGQTICRDY